MITTSATWQNWKKKILPITQGILQATFCTSLSIVHQVVEVAMGCLCVVAQLTWGLFPFHFLKTFVGTDNILPEDSAKFGYRSERKVEFSWNQCQKLRCKCGDFNPDVFTYQYDKFGPFFVNLQSSTRGMPQIWLEISQESKLLESSFVLFWWPLQMDCLNMATSNFFPEKYGYFATFFQKQSFAPLF
jgi:hypothetical protein